MVELMIDGVSVARAEVDDLEEPSNLSLVYRGKVAEDTDVLLVMMAV